jgi:hypothetical protein
MTLCKRDDMQYQLLSRTGTACHEGRRVQIPAARPNNPFYFQRLPRKKQAPVQPNAAMRTE